MNPALIPMKDTDLAWAAGFLDGEGCFYIYRGETRGYESIRACVKANQAIHDLPIRRLHDMFGGQFWERNQKTVNGKPVFEWQIQSIEDIKNALPLVIPYMIVKRKQAELILELAGYRGKFGRGGNPNKNKCDAIFEQFNALRWDSDAIPA